MNCKNCRSEVDEGAKFCTHCGKDLLKIDNPNEVVLENKSVFSNYKGLGGWLSVVGLSLFVRLFYLLQMSYTDFSYFNDGTLESVSKVIQGYGGALEFEIIMGIALSLVLIYLIYLFFKKGKNFPKYFIYYLIADVVFGFLGYFILSSLTVYSDAAQQVINDILSKQESTLFIAVVTAVIWIWYMKKSQRVKNTFIND